MAERLEYLMANTSNDDDKNYLSNILDILHLIRAECPKDYSEDSHKSGQDAFKAEVISASGLETVKSLELNESVQEQEVEVAKLLCKLCEEVQEVNEEGLCFECEGAFVWDDCEVHGPVNAEGHCFLCQEVQEVDRAEVLTSSVQEADVAEVLCRLCREVQHAVNEEGLCVLCEGAFVWDCQDCQSSIVELGKKEMLR